MVFANLLRGVVRAMGSRWMLNMQIMRELTTRECVLT
jgi:hypothetical protein